MDQPIADGIGDGRIGDQLVPVVSGDLAGDQRGTQPVAILEQLEDVMLLIGAEGLEPPVVEHEQIDAGDGFEQAGVAAVALGERQLLQEAWQPEVHRAVSLSTGFVGERAGEVGLADAGRADDEHVVMLLDPGTLGQLQEQRLIQPAAVAEVDVLDTGRLAQLGLLQSRGELAVLAVADLPVHQQPQALFEAESFGVGGVHQLLEGKQHPEQAQLGEFFEQRMSQHRLRLLSAGLTVVAGAADVLVAADL